NDPLPNMLVQRTGGATWRFVPTLQPGARAEHATRTVAFPLEDRLGSVIATVDGNGALVSTRQYDAFGALKTSTGAADSTGFDGSFSDPDSGLVFIEGRPYDPALGRFLTRAPFPGTLLEPQTQNRY